MQKILVFWTKGCSQPRCIICKERFGNANMVPQTKGLGKQLSLMMTTWPPQEPWIQTRGCRNISWIVWKYLTRRCASGVVTLLHKWFQVWVDAVKAVRSPKKRRTDISYVAKMWIQMCVVDLDLSLAYPQPKHLENHWFIPYYWTLKYIGCTLTMTVSSGLLFFTSSYLHRHITAS